uniref:Uncharacterized protein n=1 Tax=Tanacetum cinerariifolium TaxID=118510 RepID=A0A6L2J3Q6_TANCI|nr:hypothetical protein [Tanacetum cinerariifolium]
MELCEAPYEYAFENCVDTTYWEGLIQHIGYDSASTTVEIDLTWSLGLVSVELAFVEAQISLIKLEFSSCLFADSLINLLRVSSIDRLHSKLDMPYPMEVDMPYRFIDQNNVGAVAVASPVEVLKLDTHSSSEDDPLQSSLPPVSVAPMVLPFLEDIPIGRLYRTHLGGPYHHRVIHLQIIHHLGILVRVIPYLDIHHQKPPMLIHPPLAKALRCSEAYLHWRSAPLSTMYPLMTFESSVGDSSSESSTGPSHKRCRSPTATVTSSIHSTRALVPSHADLLPPRKRFRVSISPKDSVKKDIETNVLEDIEADATVVKVAVDRDVEAGIDAGIGMEVNVRIDVEDKVEDEVESSDRGTIEVGVDMDVGIDIPDGMLMPEVVEHLERVKEGLLNIYDHVI